MQYAILIFEPPEAFAGRNQQNEHDPVLAAWRTYHRSLVDAGGLMSFGASFPEQFRQAATFVVKILEGARPADLPVEQPTRLELVINMRAAMALGLTIPQSVLLRADEVIR